MVNRHFIRTAGIASLLLALFATLFGGPVFAGTTATVAATVTTQNISVSVASGTVAYGTLGSNVTKSTIAADLNDTQVATNNGNVAEDFNVEGQNSVSWTLAATAGSNQYIHRFCVATCGTPPTNYTALTTSFQALASNVAANGTQNMDLQINTPNPSTNFTQQSVDVTVQAVIH